VGALTSLYGGTLPRTAQIHVDGTVMAFGLALTAVVGVVVGLIPLLRVRQEGLSEALKEGSRGTSARPSRLGRTLVALEIALAVVVVSGAALLANSMWHLQKVDLGVTDADQVMTFTVSLPAASYPDGAAIGNFAEALDARLGAVPGVNAVGLVNRLPLLGGDNRDVTAFGDPSRKASFVSVRMISPGYFQAVAVPLRAGRWLDATEFRGSTNSVIINETLARQLFAGEDPLGQRIDAFGDEGLRVVGVCADIAGGLPDKPAPPAFYIPLATVLRVLGSRPRSADDYWGVSALVRTVGDPHALVPDFRAAVRGIDPQLPLTQVETLQDIAVARLGTRRFATSLFGVFAGLALLLGAVGVYGVMSFSVTRRAPELGMRMALGATRGTVLRTVLGQGLRLTVPGVVIGLVAALLSARVLGTLLFEVSALDPWSYVTVVAVLTLVSLAAAWLPARRATRVDPLTSMRSR
jgi:predicted permease